MKRILRLPLPAVLVMGLVVSAGAFFAIRVVTRPGEPIAERLIAAVIPAVMLTIAFGVLVLVERRRSRGEEPLPDGARAAIGRAVRTGVLPAGADPVLWTRELERDRIRWGRNRWVMPAMLLIAVPLCVVVAVVAGPVWWWSLLLIAVAWACSIWEARRAVRRLDALLEQLRQVPSGEAAR